MEHFTELFNLFSRDNITYLCADTHNYQKTIIVNNNTGSKLKQFIVGTGGADLDELPAYADPLDKKIVKNTLDNSFTYVSLEEQKNYGYLDCVFNPNTLEFACSFVKIPSEDLGGGNYYKKYMKYKHKYLSIKHL